MSAESRSGGSVPEGYALRAGEPGDGAALAAIDRAGTALLASHGFPSLMDDLIDERGMAALTEGRGVWVMDGPSGLPVGFAVASDEGAFVYLHELSVDPEHGRRGVGTALLKAVIDHARWSFHTLVALDTFRTVPFNAPFYSARGFLALDREAVPPPIAALAEAGRPPRVHPASRTVMVRRI